MDADDLNLPRLVRNGKKRIDNPIIFLIETMDLIKEKLEERT